jgi:predicted phage terminase large subunit-like protein
MSVVNDKSALRDWNAHVKAILQSTEVNHLEDPYVQSKRIEKLESNIVNWCNYYFPHYASSEFAPFHKRFFDCMTQTTRSVIVREWARSHAKSVTAMMSILFLMMTGRNKNMLLVSYNESNAIELLTPFRLELESNQRLIHDYGMQRSFSSWEAGRFTTRGGATFRALGSGQSPRGARNQEQRPDIILCDDLDEDEMCRNPQRLDQAYEWMWGSLYGCFDITGQGLFVVIGNRIAKDSLMVRSIAKADYYEQINLLDDENKPSWSRYTLAECQYMIDKMGYRLSQREYFNNPISEGKVFKKEWMQFADLPPLRNYKALVAYLDPGFKKTKTSDTKSWIMVGLYEGKFHVRKVFCGLASISEMIAWGYELDDYAKSKHAACQLKMEEVFLQDLLYKDFAAEGVKRNKPLAVSGDKRKKPDKDSRIAAMSGYFERGNVFFDRAIEEDHHCKALIEQLTSFEQGVKCRKDGPDALEGAVFILQQMIIASAPIRSQPKKISSSRL